MSGTNSLEPALQTAETVRSASRPTNDMTAYDLYLRGYAIARRGGDAGRTRLGEALQPGCGVDAALST